MISNGHVVLLSLLEKRAEMLRASRILERDGTQQVLDRFIALLESALIKSTLFSSKTPAFDPTLVVDLRNGYFESFVISVAVDNLFFGKPRPIKVEEAGQVSASRNQTPLCAYRRRRGSNWTACSLGRLEQLTMSEDHELASDIFAYASQLLQEVRQSTFDRLWFAFLSQLTETDSGQDYDRVVILVDDAVSEALIRNSLPRVGKRLDRQGQKWQSALTVCISPSTDIRGFAFFRAPEDVTANHDVYLLLTDESTAWEYQFRGVGFEGSAVSSPLRIGRYRKIVAFTEAERALNDPNILTFTNESEFSRACIIGYVAWWMQIDKTRLGELRERSEALARELAREQARTRTLQTLLTRLQRVLGQVQNIRNNTNGIHRH